MISHIWHSWNEDQRKDYIEKFCACTPAIGDSFTIPPNSGRKPGFQQREGYAHKIDITVNATENITVIGKPCSSSNTFSSDPCKHAEVDYELQMSRKCGEPINKDDVRLVKSYGRPPGRIKRLEGSNKSLDLCMSI